ncbi:MULTISPECIES: hypothetical protein [Neisseria]|uniref:hypothetical protein n=1 Tax=Neisseria TaxID=482 RepID=UPI00265A7CED|nr:MULTISPECIES: hypothetical protein [Neisseria]
MVMLFAGVLVLLGCLASFGGFFGVISPKLMRDRKTGKIKTRRHFAAAMVVGMFLFMLGVGIIAADNPGSGQAETVSAKPESAASQPENVQAAAKAKTAQDETRKDMPISFEELRQRINRQMALLDKPETKPIPKTAKPWGDKDSVNFTYQFDASKNISILISANPENNNPRGIIVLATPAEGSEAIDLLALFAKSIAIQTAPIADGSRESKETGAKILKMATKLVEEFSKNPEEQAKDSFVKDGFEYGVALTPGMPFMFTVDVKE